jgi:hypothetical protein
MKHTASRLPLAALLLVLPFSAVDAFGQAQAVLTRQVPWGPAHRATPRRPDHEP